MEFNYFKWIILKDRIKDRKKNSGKTFAISISRYQLDIMTLLMHNYWLQSFQTNSLIILQILNENHELNDSNANIIHSHTHIMCVLCSMYLLEKVKIMFAMSLPLSLLASFVCFSIHFRRCMVLVLVSRFTLIEWTFRIERSHWTSIFDCTSDKIRRTIRLQWNEEAK